MTIPKKYFDVLGIAPTTNKTVIKKAYRQLAFKFHPDVNPSQQAHQKFIEITEAYEICLGERIITSKRESTVKKTPQQEREERMQRAREFYRQSKIKEEKKNQIYFESLTSGKKWQFLKVFSLISALFALLLIIDYALPPQEEKANIQSFLHTPFYTQIKLQNKTYYFKNIYFSGRKVSKYVILKRSQIFNDVKTIKFITKQNYFILAQPNWTVFSMLWLFVPLFILPLMVVLYKKPTVWFTFFYSISLYVIPVVFIGFILTRSWFESLLGWN